MALVDVLIPTCNRPTALAITLTSVLAQTASDFRLIVSDQSTDGTPWDTKEIQAVLRVLAIHGHDLEIHTHLPARGMAEHRDWLLSRARSEYVLFLDDDLILEPFVFAALLTAMREERCGFVGSAVIGLSYAGDFRPDEQAIELWERRVEPEAVRPGTYGWERYKLHNAANLLHVQERLSADPASPEKYRVAWVGGCVLYDTAKLRQAGGFSFWRELPARHCGEDVLAQLRVMQLYGGCGIIPSGVYHQELPTTLPDRSVNAPDLFDLYEGKVRDVHTRY